MNVNDYSIRKQVRADVSVASSDPRRLENLEDARMVLVSPGGVQAKVRPYRITRGGKRFKAARAELVFKLVEDTASRQRSNVPRGYFDGEGPYHLRIEMRGEHYRGQFSFAQSVALRVTQDGVAQSDFALDAAAPIELSTLPQSFGPVYYKRQDAGNAFYQLANMEDALQRADFRVHEESPRWFLQLRVGRSGSQDTQLLDPAAYISGALPHLIRADLAQSPMVIPAGGLNAGSTLLIDFSREKSQQDNVLHSSSEAYSASLEVRERVAYIFELR